MGQSEVDGFTHTVKETMPVSGLSYRKALVGHFCPVWHKST